MAQGRNTWKSAALELYQLLSDIETVVSERNPTTLEEYRRALQLVTDLSTLRITVLHEGSGDDTDLCVRQF